ncbi:MAG: phage terminase large subunit [Salinisphaera sp.]|jgi:hypothetical protein|nr:phage terminase large subunit [Salinisphaera sp.]
MTTEVAERIEPSPFQARVLEVPESINLFLGGGRGGAKSYCLALMALRHVEQYGNRAKILYLRQSYRGLADFEQITRDLFHSAYGLAAKFNATDHVWKFPSGAVMELGQLEGVNDYPKYQGRSFTLLLIDEAGQFAAPSLLDRLRSNLRGPKGMPIREIRAANPAGPGHQWIAQRYVFRAAPWQPFQEPKTGAWWVHCPSVFTDNPFIDADEYRRQLEASCPADPELLRAWLSGDWSVSRGAYFAGVLDEDRNAVAPWEPGKLGDGWRMYLSHDFGSSAPSVTYVCCESPGGEGPDHQFYPRGSVVLVDELATNQPGHLDAGMQYTAVRLADEIREMADRWGMRPDGVADDAIFAQHGSQAGSIADEFKRAGVYFMPAKKGSRQSGWETMRRMLQDAGKPDVPGLYISRSAEYFWATVPYLGRDPRKPEDLDTRAADHAADSCRYALTRQERKPVKVQRIVGF